MAKNKAFKQQGDVLLLPYNGGIPSGFARQDDLIIARGEVTGHMHEVTVGDAVLYRNAEAMILEVLSDEAVITHQTHGPQTLTKGRYKVGIVREYDHFAEEARRVAD